MTTIVNRAARAASLTVSTSADRMTAWQVRAFVGALDMESVPDRAEVRCRHSHDTHAFIGLTVQAEDLDLGSRCGRTDVVTGLDGRELLFRCDREVDHDGRHHAANVEGAELFWERSGSSIRAR